MDMAVALSRVETHLQLNPTDGRGWEVLAPFYMRAGRYDDAARAFANAATHLGPRWTGSSTSARRARSPPAAS